MRPYYTDPYTVEFDATVRQSLKWNGATAVLLDNSYFSPTSGGQEHDTGKIGNSTVVDVVEDDENVLHIVSEDPDSSTVHCKIDWDRRFRNMQQHTGQHILSAAFENLLDIQTVSSRLGESIGTIDLSRAPTEKELSEAVAAATKVVEENRPVNIHFADKSDISRFRLRKPPKVEGTVRIVEVKDFDFSPCGGTHCTHTSEVGVILTGTIEKVKGALTRIEFTCGRRATDYYYGLLNSSIEISRLVSAPVADIPSAVIKLSEQLHEKEKQLKVLLRKLADAVYHKIVPVVDQTSEKLPVINMDDDVTDAEELRFVASTASRELKKSFLFYRTEGENCQMVVNLVVDEKKAADIVDHLRKSFGVKGGGRNGFYSLILNSFELPGVIENIKGALSND